MTAPPPNSPTRRPTGPTSRPRCRSANSSAGSTVRSPTVSAAASGCVARSTASASATSTGTSRSSTTVPGRATSANGRRWRRRSSVRRSSACAGDSTRPGSPCRTVSPCGSVARSSCTGRSGRLTFRVSDIDPQFTLGHLALQRDALLRRLAADGLRRAQPDRSTYPSCRCGSVSSPAGSPTAGTTSAPTWPRAGSASTSSWRRSPCRARRRRSRSAGRSTASAPEATSTSSPSFAAAGAGATSPRSTTSEWPRRSPTARCRSITGVGHDLDRSVADHVAHTATKTPTACAQFLIDRVRSFTSELDRCSHAVAHAANRTLSAAGAVLARDRHRLQVAARRSIRDAARPRRSNRPRRDRRCPGHTRRRRPRPATRANAGSSLAARRAVRSAESRLDQVTTRFERRPGEVLRHEQHRLDVLAARLRAVDPEHALEPRMDDHHDARRPHSCAASHELQPGSTDHDAAARRTGAQYGHAGGGPDVSDELRHRVRSGDRRARQHPARARERRRRRRSARRSGGAGAVPDHAVPRSARSGADAGARHPRRRRRHARSSHARRRAVLGHRAVARTCTGW